MTPSGGQQALERARAERRKQPSKDRPATTARFYTNFEGYERWRAYDTDGVYDSLMVHRLLAALEWGLDAIRGKHVHHKNGIPWDNRVENLEIVDPGEHQKIHAIPTEELLDELRAAADALGRTPSITELNEFGEYSYGPYVNRFGCWTDALKAAGLTPHYDSPSRYSDEEILGELARVGNGIGRMPTYEEFREQGEMSPSTVSNRFGSWLDALDAARDHPDWNGESA